MRVRAQVQYPEEKLFRLDERVPMRYQVMGEERCLLPRPERLPSPVLLQRLLQVPEKGPLRGQALAQPSRGREEFGQSRSQNSLRGKDLEHNGGDEIRRQKADAGSQKRRWRPRRNGRMSRF